MSKLTKKELKFQKTRYEDMLATFKEVADKHNLKEEVVLETFKQSVRNVFARARGGDDLNIKVILNEDDYDFEAQFIKSVVATDDDIDDDALQICLEKAKVINPEAEVGTEIIVEQMLVGKFPLRLATNVNSNFRQQLIELEKEQLFLLFKDKIGEMVKGVIEKNDRTTYVNLGVTSILFDERGRHAIPGEVFRTGQEVNFYVVDVVAGPKGADIIISRSDPRFVKRLMEREIHEIYDGTIVIHDIVREEGERVKVSVESLDINVDPVGACIGPNANRIQKITAELGPDGRKEKIDIIPFEKNSALYIIEAFRPAVPIGVDVNEEAKTANVIFYEDDKGKAFGHKGANVRLASKLTGFNVQVLGIEEANEKGITYKTKDHIAYEQRLIDQEKTRERMRQEVAEPVVTTPRTTDSFEIEFERSLSATTDVVEVIPSVIETPSVDVTKPAEKVVEKVVEEPVVKAVKTTISLADLERQLEKEEKPTEVKKERPYYKPRREEKSREPEIEIVATGPKMDIYTDEELEKLAELEKTHEEVFEEDDIDYEALEEFEDYYE